VIKRVASIIILFIPLTLSSKESCLDSTANWGLDTGPYSIKVCGTQELSKSPGKVNVAVIDSGIDPTHKVFRNHLWSPSKAKGSFGWSVKTNKINPVDQHGHGTHVAGIIAAVSSSALGKANSVFIMPIEYYSSVPQAGPLDTTKAINYAVRHGAKIINMSGGGEDPEEKECLAIYEAKTKNILFVAAAGNDAKELGVHTHYYPAEYGMQNIIIVGGVTHDGDRLPHSNYGKKVDVLAPSDDIFSYLSNGQSGTMTGTSQATAFVSGIAAVLLADDQSLTAIELKHVIETSAIRYENLRDITSSGVANLSTAVKYAKSDEFRTYRRAQQSLSKCGGDTGDGKRFPSATCPLASPDEKPIGRHICDPPKRAFFFK
jgi:major intracellular serine protease